MGADQQKDAENDAKVQRYLHNHRQIGRALKYILDHPDEYTAEDVKEARELFELFDSNVNAMVPIAHRLSVLKIGDSINPPFFQRIIKRLRLWINRLLKR